MKTWKNALGKEYRYTKLVFCTESARIIPDDVDGGSRHPRPDAHPVAGGGGGEGDDEDDGGCAAGDANA